MQSRHQPNQMELDPTQYPGAVSHLLNAFAPDHEGSARPSQGIEPEAAAGFSGWRAPACMQTADGAFAGRAFGAGSAYPKKSVIAQVAYEAALNGDLCVSAADLGYMAMRYGVSSLQEAVVEFNQACSEGALKLHGWGPAMQRWIPGGSLASPVCGQLNWPVLRGILRCFKREEIRPSVDMILEVCEHALGIQCEAMDVVLAAARAQPHGVCRIESADWPVDIETIQQKSAMPENAKLASVILVYSEFEHIRESAFFFPAYSPWIAQQIEDAYARSRQCCNFEAVAAGLQELWAKAGEELSLPLVIGFVQAQRSKLLRASQEAAGPFGALAVSNTSQVSAGQWIWKWEKARCAHQPIGSNVGTASGGTASTRSPVCDATAACTGRRSSDQDFLQRSLVPLSVQRERTVVSQAQEQLYGGVAPTAVGVMSFGQATWHSKGVGVNSPSSSVSQSMSFAGPAQVSTHTYDGVRANFAASAVFERPRVTFCTTGEPTPFLPCCATMGLTSSSGTKQPLHSDSNSFPGQVSVDRAPVALRISDALSPAPNRPPVNEGKTPGEVFVCDQNMQATFAAAPAACGQGASAVPSAQTQYSVAAHAMPRENYGAAEGEPLGVYHAGGSRSVSPAEPTAASGCFAVDGLMGGCDEDIYQIAPVGSSTSWSGGSSVADAYGGCPRTDRLGSPFVPHRENAPGLPRGFPLSQGMGSDAAADGSDPYPCQLAESCLPKFGGTAAPIGANGGQTWGQSSAEAYILGYRMPSGVEVTQKSEGNDDAIKGDDKNADRGPLPYDRLANAEEFATSLTPFESFAMCFRIDLLDGKSLYLSQINNLFKLRTKGQELAYKSIGYQRLGDFILSIPGLYMLGSGTSLSVVVENKKSFQGFLHQCNKSMERRLAAAQNQGLDTTELESERFKTPKRVPRKILDRIWALFKGLKGQDVNCNTFLATYNDLYAPDYLRYRAMGYVDIRAFMAAIPFVMNMGKRRAGKYVLRPDAVWPAPGGYATAWARPSNASSSSGASNQNHGRQTTENSHPSEVVAPHAVYRL